MNLWFKVTDLQRHKWRAPLSSSCFARKIVRTVPAYPHGRWSSMNESSNSAAIKLSLRQELKAARIGLSAGERIRLDLQICAHLQRLLESCADVNLAAYHACRGEPDLAPALTMLHGAGHRVHLPVLIDRELRFRRWSPDADMTPNRYGIPEPLEGSPCSAEQLDWVLLPLVAFSASGGRLGMGGGFYDRTFSFCLDRPPEQRPRLVGIAYALQQIDSLPLERWDVPLDGVLTEMGMRWISAARE